MKQLSAFSEPAYAMLRVVSGLMFAFHGAQLLFGLWSPNKAAFPSQMWIGGAIELLGGLAIAIGTRTRLAAFLCSGTMAVAYCQFHWHFATGRRFFPPMNQGELSVLYCLIFFYIACRGGGTFAVGRD